MRKFKVIAGGKATTSKPSGSPQPPAAIGEAYAWSGDRLIEAAPLYADGSIAWDQATAWAYAPDRFTPLAQMRNGKLWYIVSDPIGTPRELLTERGEVAWSNRPEPWGQANLWTAPAANDDTAVDCPLRFPGQYYDPESGLHYNRHRYYDPETAQYLSPDPLGLAGGARPQGYVENPNTRIDPLGLAGCSPKPTASSLSDRDFLQRIAEAAERWGVQHGYGAAGSGPAQGSRKHAFADRLLQRYQRVTGQKTHLETEQSFLSGIRVPTGTAGSARPDVYDPTTGAVYDYKFTRSPTSPISQRQRANNSRNLPYVTSQTAIHP